MGFSVGNRIPFTVVLDGFSYDDLSKIAKDFECKVSDLEVLYKRNRREDRFQSVLEDYLGIK